MTEIKFRGKRIDNGEWVEGYYAFINDVHYIYTGGLRNCGLYVIAERFEIDPETVCQYTGLKDKNGAEIYESDIVRIKVPRIDGTFNEGIFKCEYYEGSFWFLCNDDDKFYQGGSYGYSDTMYKNIEVIGNVWDNKELLEAEE